MTAPGLRRDLGVAGATLLGLGSILGTGVFVSIGLAAGEAELAVVSAIAVAAALALCNALSSAQLAAAYPVSGGTYEYGRRLLDSRLGFVAGWVFLCAKTASAAAAALGAAGYLCHLLDLAPGPWLGPGAAGIVLLMTLLVRSGLRRTSRANAAIVSLTLLALVAFAAVGLWQLGSGTGSASEWSWLEVLPGASGAEPESFLYATALMFVAYTGYARIATLGEEVREPAQTIPRAILITLAVSAALYVLVALAALGAVAPQTLAASAKARAVPLETAAAAMAVPGLSALLALGAVTAMLGVLLNLLLGLSRVVLAMGRHFDLPPGLASLDSRGTPAAAVLLVGGVVAGIAAFGRVEVTWAFSAFTVLVYYAITNLAALKLPRDQRRYPAAVAWLGLAGCSGLVPFLPGQVWVLAAILLSAGLSWRALARRLWPMAAPPNDSG